MRQYSEKFKGSCSGIDRADMADRSFQNLLKYGKKSDRYLSVMIADGNLGAGPYRYCFGFHLNNHGNG
jgi:hypothetical protein